MPPLSNARHERFAQSLFEGKSADEAFVTAGYKQNRGNASRLKANENVKARLAELQNETAATARVTLETILGDLADAAAVAKDRGQAQALVSAAMSKAKLLGLDVQRIEIGSPRDFDGLTSTAAIVDRVLERLIEAFIPIDAADREGLIALYEKQFAETEEYLAAIRARPICAERVDPRHLDIPWQQRETYSARSPAKLTHRTNGTKQV